MAGGYTQQKISGAALRGCGTFFVTQSLENSRLQSVHPTVQCCFPHPAASRAWNHAASAPGQVRGDAQTSLACETVSGDIILVTFFTGH